MGWCRQGWGVEQFTDHDQPLCGDDGPEHGDVAGGDCRAVLAECGNQWGAGGAEPGRVGSERAVCAVFRREYAGFVVALGSAGPVVAVDDLRGFTTAFVNGVQSPVGATTNLAVTIRVERVHGGRDDGGRGEQLSTTPGGRFGDVDVFGERERSGRSAALGSAVQAANASVVIRPGDRRHDGGADGRRTR